MASHTCSTGGGGGAAGVKGLGGGGGLGEGGGGEGLGGDGVGDGEGPPPACSNHSSFLGKFPRLPGSPIMFRAVRRSLTPRSSACAPIGLEVGPGRDPAYLAAVLVVCDIQLDEVMKCLGW